jgi:hypothetical protein
VPGEYVGSARYSHFHDQADLGALRADTDFADIGRIVGGIAVSPGAGDEQKERMLQIVLDGLRTSA